MPLERFVEVTSSNAAKILGLYPKKGAIAVGSDADLVVFDPTVRRTCGRRICTDPTTAPGRAGRCTAGLSTVLLRGKVAVQDGKLLGQAGDGRRVPGKLGRRDPGRPTSEGGPTWPPRLPHSERAARPWRLNRRSYELERREPVPRDPSSPSGA
jgi:hypothetical protein